MQVLKFSMLLLLCMAMLTVHADDYIDEICSTYADEADRVACSAELKANNKPQPAKPVAKAPTVPAGCGNDLYCLADKFWMGVESQCPQVIERLASYDYEWIDGWTESKFKQLPIRTEHEYVVRFYGDKLKLQNGFGAWSRVTYTCDVNTVTGNIVDVGAAKGRL